MEEKKILRDFLNDQLPSYENPKVVQVYLNSDNTLFICSKYPGIEMPENVSLELFREVRSMSHFFSLFNISSIDQLLKLDPSDLLELYERGHMYVICTLEEPLDHEIYFRKYNKSFGVIADSKETDRFEIQLNKPEDYIDFTFRYFNIDRKRSFTSSS